MKPSEEEKSTLRPEELRPDGSYVDRDFAGIGYVPNDPIETTTISTGWIPETDLHRLAVIGKLGEELCEAALMCFRTIIQGVDGINPKTGETNIDALEKELTDVAATSAFARRNLPISELPNRFRDKIRSYNQWHNLIDEHLKAKLNDQDQR